MVKTIRVAPKTIQMLTIRPNLITFGYAVRPIDWLCVKIMCHQKMKNERIMVSRGETPTDDVVIETGELRLHCWKYFWGSWDLVKMPPKEDPEVTALKKEVTDIIEKFQVGLLFDI